MKLTKPQILICLRIAAVTLSVIALVKLYQSEWFTSFKRHLVEWAHETPRPADAGFIKWIELFGSKIVLKKGIVFDDKWEIKPGQISEFYVHRLTENAEEHSYTATVSFLATSYGQGIRVSEAKIRYRDASEPNTLEFVEFIPISVKPIGN
jgi:hypothetical protein